MTTLDDLPSACFDGAIPCGLATCDAEGMPHATWLSQAFKLDAQHVAVSCQFFRKTKENLTANPNAQLLVVDPVTSYQWRLDMRFEGSVSTGPLFERMDRRIAALAAASTQEHGHAFALRSVEVFAVHAVVPVPVDRPPPPERPPPTRDAFSGLAQIAATVSLCTDLGTLVDRALASIAEHLGFARVALYVIDESDAALYALGSRGFSASGIGARIGLGVGIVGTCAQHRMPVRVADATRELRYQRAVLERLTSLREHGDARDIPLPGLDGARSLLAVPLVVRGKVHGVLTTESEVPYAFDDQDEKLFATAAQLVASALVLTDEADADREIASPAAVEAASHEEPLRIRYYDADDSVFVDDDYLIKGLPGRILYLLLSTRQTEGRATFQNRELRLHPFLKLPSYKDNLEARLLMLQRRLEEKGTSLRLHREERGKLRVACDQPIVLERVAT